MEKVPRKRHHNGGIRKVCGCARTKWAKCPHGWHLNFKPKGGPSYRLSLDSYVGRHLKGRTEAQGEAEKIRTLIREGKFSPRPESATLPAPVTPTETITLSSFWATYEQRLGRPVTENSRSCYAQLCAFPLDGRPFGEKALAAVTEDDVEVFMADLRAKGLAASTRNKYVQVIKAVFRWATKKGYLTRNPTSDSAALVRERHARRDRRLEAGEESALLKYAWPQLQRLIVAALETGCRRGELLSLTWRDVNLDRREMTIRAETSKTRTARIIPISDRLVGVLKMARTDPAGEEFGAEAFVFGDAVGRKVGDIKRAWETAVLKAHGHTPKWTRGHALADASREAFRAANLTFHDLRHEAGSRLLEAAGPSTTWLTCLGTRTSARRAPI
jgi:integrase